MIDLKEITPFALNEGMKGDGLYLPLFEELPLMQYTGLKDKNGKEIYEGDILNNYIIGVNFEIKWLNQDAGFYALAYNYHYDPNDWCIKGEVIGNIYENPELLTPPQP